MTDYSFFQYLESDAVVLTPNRRLSATLHKHYQHYQLEQQLETWATPSILPVTNWIQELWENDAYATPSENPYLLLNNTQEHYLWESILLAHKKNEQLLQLSETADLIKSAWGLLKQWQIDLHHPAFHSTEDYIALQQWIQQFQTLCEKHKWIDQASLPDHLIQYIESKRIIPPRYIILFGFTEYSPQLKALLNACENNNSQIISSESDAVLTEGKRIALLDQEHEIQTLARWAKAKLKNNPQAKIGCVIPDLDKIRDRVAQLFAEVFADENTYTLNPQHAPFNISAGKNLTQYPIIYAALQALSLHKQTLPLETFTYLLATPFIGEAESERIKRAHYDRLLRTHNKNTIQLHALLQDETKLSLLNHCPQLTKRLHAFLATLPEANQTFSYSEWAMQFTHLLTALGWPGERSLNSEEYQIVESWLKLLNEFASLDYVAAPIHLNQALHRLQKLATKSVFQPKSPETPIQVLGVLEAAGLPFDHLWVAGMDDLAWPPQPKPNPFIPKILQRELQMPHATAERELLFCTILTTQFKQNTADLIISHAEQNEALELQASPLIRDVPLIAIETLALENYKTPSEKIFLSKQMESLIDDTAPHVSSNETIRGGVSVIKQQALCPFKSFAEWRLHAHDFEEPSPGLRAKDRGTVVHKTLELLWNQLKDHASLIALSDSELTNLIQQSIELAMTLTPTSHSEFKQYIRLEKQRLQKLLWEWLQIEKLRTPFTVISHEKTMPLSLGELSLTLKIDRIDELANGKKLIIDYKTGKQNDIHRWFSERPEEPQLPLYALLNHENISGISFAQVHTGEHAFKGVSQDEIAIDGIKSIAEIKKTTATSWDEQIQQWDEILKTLSHRFYHGDAKVDPKEIPKTCDWCALKPLCRINEEKNHDD